MKPLASPMSDADSTPPADDAGAADAPATRAQKAARDIPDVSTALTQRDPLAFLWAMSEEEKIALFS